MAPALSLSPGGPSSRHLTSRRLFLILGLLFTFFVFREYLLPSSASSEVAPLSTSKIPTWTHEAPEAEPRVSSKVTVSAPATARILSTKTTSNIKVTNVAQDDAKSYGDSEAPYSPHAHIQSTTPYSTIPTNRPAVTLATVVPAQNGSKFFNESEVPSLSPPAYLPCRTLPGAEDVLVVMKTGGTEAFARIPEQLLTLHKCVPKYMVFSDLAQDIGDFHIYDALEEVSEEYKDTHEDFELYKDLKRVHAEHGDVTSLGSEKGWNLDKWKNVPMLHRAYVEHPEVKWYVFLDADTYLGWSNLLQVLNSIDSTDPHYFGTIYFHGETAFAQGGTGYIISNEAVRRFEAIRNAEYIAKWELETSTICCGDVMLSIALKDAGVNVSGAWPLLVPDGPAFIDWGDWLWCEPSVTWHHVKSHDVEALWHFEQNWVNRTIHDGGEADVFLYRDLFNHFIQPYISASRHDWDNLSRDRVFTEPIEDHPKENNDWDWKSDEEKQEMWDGWDEDQKKSVESAKACRATCESDSGCMQWLWKPGSCSLNWSIRLGHAVDPSNNTVAGWMTKRVKQFKKKQEPCMPKWKPEDGE